MKACAYCGMQRPNHRATCPSPRREADALEGGIDGHSAMRCADSPVAPERSASATGTSESRQSLGGRLVAAWRGRGGRTVGHLTEHSGARLSVPKELGAVDAKMGNANNW